MSVAHRAALSAHWSIPSDQSLKATSLAASLHTAAAPSGPPAARLLLAPAAAAPGCGGEYSRASWAKGSGTTRYFRAAST